MTTTLLRTSPVESVYPWHGGLAAAQHAVRHVSLRAGMSDAFVAVRAAMSVPTKSERGRVVKFAQVGATHVVEPVCGAIKGAVHAVQLEAPPEENVLGGHGVGLTELRGHAAPGGQRTGAPEAQ